MSSVLEKVEKLYPDKNIFSLHYYPALYKECKDEAELEGLSNLEEYFNSHGFCYNTESFINIKESEIKNELEVLFPDKVVSNIRQANTYLYNRIYTVARFRGFNLDEYLGNIGYTYYGRLNGKFAKSAIDQLAVRKLNKLFDYKLEEIGNMIGVSRQQVSFVMKNGSKADSWIPSIIDEKVHDNFKYMILEHLFEYQDNLDETTYIIKNNNENDILLLWYSQTTSIQCLFNDNIPNDLVSLCKEAGMDKYTTQDFDFMPLIKVVHIFKKPYILLTNESEDFFTKGMKSHKMNKVEYSNYMGFCGYYKDNRDLNYDEHLIEIFEENIIDGKVQIKGNNSLYNYASRNNYSIRELVEFFGYEYATMTFEVQTKHINEKYKNILKKFIIKDPNYITISLDSELYKNIYNISKKLKVSIKDYLNELGFQHFDSFNNHVEKPSSSITGKKLSLEDLASRLKHLNEIESHKTKYERREVNNRKRNKEIVKELKEIYDYKCQLCLSENLFPIKMKDGTAYVEVHHIIPLADELTTEQMYGNSDALSEDEYLDILSNLIVVCPNHHKYLHYHNGGRFTILKKDDQTLLANKKGDTIKIQTDYHLNM